MTPRDQARLIAHNQRIAKQRQVLFAAIESGQVPMDLIMDERLPLTSQERQNSWNQLAANQWSARQASLRGEGEVAAPVESFTGTPNQFQQSLAMLQRSPEWQTMSEEGRAKLLQAKFGTEIATRYISSIKDREAIDVQRRKTFDDTYETERTIGRERRQSAARLADTEPEMLSRRLLSGDWVVRGGGMFERNPAYNPNNPLAQDIPPFVPLSSSGEATVARHWSDVMPNRPNPLGAEKLMRIRVAEENPDLDAESIVKMAQARMAALANPAGMVANADEARARQAITNYRAGIPSTAPTTAAPMLPTYNVESTDPSPNKVTGNNEPLRFGEKLNLFGLNAARDLSRIPAAIEARVGTLGKFLQRGGYRPEVNQFFSDLLGRSSESLPPPVVPVSASQTTSYMALPEWLK